MINKTTLKTLALSAAILATFTTNAVARDQIRAVGSSTVYPFMTVVAEEFGKHTSFKTPIVESTGTGGGFKLFCAGIGDSYPDFSNASRSIKQSEIDLCAKNGIKDITGIQIGFDGIVLANSVQSEHYNLSLKNIFFALAKKVPVDGKLVDNPYKKWNEIDASLPDKGISVYGPPPTSGTRDAFVELAMQKPCVQMEEFKAAFPDKKSRKKACHAIREDGAFIEAGENDNLIIQKLTVNPDSLGIFGFGFLDQNSDSVQGSVINGTAADFDNISSGTYPISRPLFAYAKDAHFKQVPGLKEFIYELVSEKAIGEEGYLTYKGLIPLHEGEYENLTETINAKLK